MSERERLYIEARYTDIVTGDLQKQIETYSRWKRTYPRDWTAPNNLGSVYGDAGDLNNSIAESLIALELNPDASYAYGNLAMSVRRSRPLRRSESHRRSRVGPGSRQLLRPRGIASAGDGPPR